MQQLHLSPQLAVEFQRIHTRFDQLELMLSKFPSLTSNAPNVPPRLTNPAMSPWCEPFIPMNAKRAIPIITPSSALLKAEEVVLASCSATLTAGEEVKEKPSVKLTTPKVTAKSLPTQELIIPPLVLDKVSPSSTTVKPSCLHCSRPFIASFRVSNNKQDPQKFCNDNCKNLFKKQNSAVWGPTLTSNIVLDSQFLPILERPELSIEFIEGPAGTGKSRLALDICRNDKESGVAYVTASWIAAFEFAKKLSSDGLIPYIPAASGNLTDIARRARAKEFPEFTNQKKCPDQITILISSMTHTSHITSHKTPETVRNKKSGCHHSMREWSTTSVPLGKSLITLGTSVPLPSTIIVDEAGTVVDSVLQTLTFGVKRVVLLGDRFQRKPITDKETTEVLKPFQITPAETNSFREVSSDRVTLLTEGHRCPRDTYALISAIYGYVVCGISTPLKTTHANVSDSVATPTNASRHKGEFTIDELQGQTCEGLIIRTRTRQDIDFLRMHPESALVALSRHTNRFSWIDTSHCSEQSTASASERVFSITEFFSRFIKKKIPHNHPDKDLVPERLIAKSVRPNSRLLSSPKPSKAQPPSDRSANNIGGVHNMARNNNGAREEVPESLSSLTSKTSVIADRGVLPTFSTVKSPTIIPPRLIPVSTSLLPKHSLECTDSPEEVPRETAIIGDHVTRACTTVKTFPGRESSELEVKLVAEKPPLYISEELTKPTESDRVSIPLISYLGIPIAKNNYVISSNQLPTRQSVETHLELMKTEIVSEIPAMIDYYLEVNLLCNMRDNTPSSFHPDVLQEIEELTKQVKIAIPKLPTMSNCDYGNLDSVQKAIMRVAGAISNVLFPFVIIHPDLLTTDARVKCKVCQLRTFPNSRGECKSCESLRLATDDTDVSSYSDVSSSFYDLDELEVPTKKAGKTKKKKK